MVKTDLRDEENVPQGVLDRLEEIEELPADPSIPNDQVFGRTVKVGEYLYNHSSERAELITEVVSLGDRVRVVTSIGRSEEYRLDEWVPVYRLYQTHKDAWGWHEPISCELIAWGEKFWLFVDGCIAWSYDSLEEAQKDWIESMLAWPE